MASHVKMPRAQVGTGRATFIYRDKPLSKAGTDFKGAGYWTEDQEKPLLSEESDETGGRESPDDKSYKKRGPTQSL